MSRLALATLALVVAGTTAASAYGPSTREVDARQANQQRRIEQGLRDGSLTRHEAQRLIEEQRRIQALESRAKADGRLDRREREVLDRAQDSASRHIYQERHDGETRGWKRWWGGNDYNSGPKRWWW